MRDSVFMAGGRIALRTPVPHCDGAGRDGAALADARGCIANDAKTQPSALLKQLREALARPEFAPPRETDLAPLSLSIPRLDALLAGGLRRDALHEIRSSLSRDSGAATGFAAAILARLAAIDARPILWVAESASVDEAGGVYGAGLERLGLDPKRLVVVRVRKAVDALWVTEEALTCRGLAAVVTEIRGAPRLLDLTATRRLALRARSGVVGLLLRQGDACEASAATTRWRAEPLPASVLGGYAAGIGFPAWHLVLERNRRGTTGAIDVEWNHVRRSFAAIGDVDADKTRPAYPVPLPALSVDGPAAAADTGKIVALQLPQWSQWPREIQRRIARAR